MHLKSIGSTLGIDYSPDLYDLPTGQARDLLRIVFSSFFLGGDVRWLYLSFIENGFFHIIYYGLPMSNFSQIFPTFPPTQIYILFLSLSWENKQASKKINEIVLCASVTLPPEQLPNFIVFISNCIACSHPHCFQVSNSCCLAMTMLQSHTFVKIPQN